MLWLVGFAQKTVTGTVKDAAGEPLIGVSVMIKGTSTGAMTDIDGNFSLPSVPSSSKLTFSYVGYKTKTVDVGSSSQFSVVLEEDNTTLEDVVVIGYGTMKRKDLTGAVASVSGDKLAANPVSNVMQALQGQLPGVSVVSQDGRPGASMAIRVRGGGSITQSNDPLYIVDGVQVSDISDIPADNIDSVDVLKDGASTAIYGARGANGVILVTTKGSKGDGKARVKYNMYYQMKKAPKNLDVMDAYHYVLHNWSYATAYGNNEEDGIAEYFGLGSKFGNHLNEYKNVDVHNYVDDVMRTAGSWSHDVSLSGGNQNTKYYATVNYMTDDGIRIKSGFQRWNANFKISQKITKNLNFDADLRYSEMKFEGTNFDYASGNSVYGYRPIDKPLGTDNSSLLSMGSSSVEESFNPLAVIDNYTNISKRQRVRGSGALSWNIIKGLTARTELSLSRNWSETKYWDGGKSTNPYNQAQLTQGNGYGLRWATTLSYQVQGLGENHDLSLLAGNEVLASKSVSNRMTGAGFPSEFDMDRAFGLIQMYNMKDDYYDQTKKTSDFYNTINEPKHTLSWFGRVNYTLMGRYLFTATFRADGSSNFAPNNHWGYFPSAAFGWRLSDEPFMASARQWLDNLKLRLSYGTAGNDDIDASLWKEFWVPEVTWNPYNAETDDTTGMTDKVIIEAKDRSKIPTCEIIDENGEVLGRYNFPVGGHVVVDDGQVVESGATLVKIPRTVSRAGDITGGLPRVTELFEARNPSNPAIVSEIDGEVKINPQLKRNNREVTIVSKTGEERKYLVPTSKQLLVQDRDAVRAGTPLSDGVITPNDILAIKGPTAVQEYIVNEVQDVYRLQGVKINDKHFEIIVRQMMRKVQINEPGDTCFLESDIVDKLDFAEENDRIWGKKYVINAGDSENVRAGEIISARKLRDENASLKRRDLKTIQVRDTIPATSTQILQGITRAALHTKSFMSAASFQETTKVLNEAAIRGKSDSLLGMKENVICGHLIPAGTGLREFEKIIVGSREDMDRRSMSRQNVFEYRS